MITKTTVQSSCHLNKAEMTIVLYYLDFYFLHPCLFDLQICFPSKVCILYTASLSKLATKTVYTNHLTTKKQ